MGIRLGIIIFLVGAGYSLLGLKIYDIQLKQGNYYRAQAASKYETAGFLLPRRGTIFVTDKSGDEIPAALTKDYPTLYAVPNDVVKAVEEGETTIEAVATALAEMTEKDVGTLSSMLNKKGDPYEPLAKKIDPALAARVEAGVLPGVYVQYEPSRYYPLEKMAAHVVGFTSTQETIWKGQYGIEYAENGHLTGELGSSAGDSLIEPIDGEDIHLTIDYNIQSQAERILSDLVTTYRASGGSIIVQDPATGAILAMANDPTFDPNDYGSFSLDTFLNPSVQAVYEPGSIFKVVTVASALDAGVITPSTMYMDTGSLILNGKTIRNWDLKAYGRVSVAAIIEHSLNIGAAFAERQLGHEAFYKYLKKFGCLEETGIDLPGEVVGSLGPLEDDPRDINFATASFGQGISVTPIRVVSAISTIANGGVMMRPYIKQRSAEETPKGTRVVSSTAARQMVDMMVSAVEKNHVAVIDGYSIAGKTGTAQVPDFHRGGYSNDVINTYAGFAPAYDPRFTILVKLDKPEGAPLAGQTVVPAFRELSRFILNYYNIPPDAVAR
jgi:cell division protein FtsI/penicillin-binding protein 2